MTPKELESILLMQIKELKLDLGKVSYEVSTRAIEKTIESKQEQLESVKELILKESEPK